MLKNLEAGSCVSTPRYFPARVIRAWLMDGHVHSSLCLHKLCFDRTPGSVYDSVYCRWAKPIVAFIQQGDRWGFFAEREWEITASTDKNARPWTETVKRCYCKINATPIQDNTEGSSVFILADSHLHQIQLNMLNGSIIRKKVSRMTLLKKADVAPSAWQLGWAGWSLSQKNCCLDVGVGESFLLIVKWV